MVWLLAAFVLLALVLSVPVTVDVSLHRASEFELSATARWGRLDLPGSPEKTSRQAGDSTRGAARAPRARAAPRERRKLRALLFSRDFLPSLVRLLRRLLRLAQPSNVCLQLKAGLGDPADTGLLWAKLAPLFGLLLALNAESIRLEPDFSRRCLELDARARVRLIPALVLLTLLGYCLSPPPWRALSRYVRAR